MQEHHLKLQAPTRDEIEQHFKIVLRDLRDAKFPELSPDRKFATAYNASLQLIEETEKFHIEVLKWLKAHFPVLV